MVMCGVLQDKKGKSRQTVFMFFVITSFLGWMLHLYQYTIFLTKVAAITKIKKYEGQFTNSPIHFLTISTFTYSHSTALSVKLNSDICFSTKTWWTLYYFHDS